MFRFGEEIINTNFESNLIQLSKPEFYNLLKVGGLAQLCDNDCILIGIDPILIHTEEDIKFAMDRKIKVSNGLLCSFKFSQE